MQNTQANNNTYNSTINKQTKLNKTNNNDYSTDYSQIENLKLKIRDLEGKITEINKGMIIY